MPVVRKIRGRGATGVVVANAEVLFTRTAPVGRWTNAFSNRASTAARNAAPTNKRPRWAHYGKPLKSTITSRTEYDPTRLRVDTAIGSTADHSVYVNEGTGVFAGNGPYPAKILPPWTRGGGSLYEHTWKPRKGAAPLGTIMIKGQKGQFFLQEGLDHAFATARMATATIPGRSAEVTSAINKAPDFLTNFLGNTRADGAFIGQLQKWREWRDRAFKSGDGLGDEVRAQKFRDARANFSGFLPEPKSRKKTSPERRLELRRDQSKRRRARIAEAKKTAKPKATREQQRQKAVNADRVRFMKRVIMTYPSASGASVGAPRFVNGRWYVTVTLKGGKTVERRSGTQF